MNPLQWKREHQAALGVAVFLGAAVGALIAYLTTPVSNRMFANWLANNAWPDTFWWSLIGAALGGGIVYARQLLRA